MPTGIDQKRSVNQVEHLRLLQAAGCLRGINAEDQML
jgi:hypothetical protein